MKKILLTMVLGVCLMMNMVSLVFAAEAGTVEESYESIGLTSEQRQQIKPLMEQREQEINAIRRDASLSAQEKQAQIDAIRAQSRTNIDQYLTSEQKAKADAVRQSTDERRTEARTQKENVQADKKQQRQDRQQLKEDGQNGDKEAVEADKAKLQEDRKNLREDKVQGHNNRSEARQQRRQNR